MGTRQSHSHRRSCVRRGFRPNVKQPHATADYASNNDIELGIALEEDEIYEEINPNVCEAYMINYKLY